MDSVSRLPVYYVVPVIGFDFNEFERVCLGNLESENIDKLVVISDLCFNHAAEDLILSVKNVVKDCVTCDCALIGAKSEDQSSPYTLNELISPSDKLKKISSGEDFHERSILFITNGDSALLAQLALVLNSHPQPLMHYDATGKTFNSELRNGRNSVNRQLMKRFLMMEKVKEAKIIGVLVGTLAVQYYGELIEKLNKLLRHMGRQGLIVCVGKLNECKLANFPEIDLFVNVACAQTTIVDCKEFYQPVVTPFELVMGLVGDEWRPQLYTFDFGQIIEMIDDYFTSFNSKQNDSSTDEQDEQDEPPVYCMASGRYVKRTSVRTGPRGKPDSDVLVETHELASGSIKSLVKNDNTNSEGRLISSSFVSAEILQEQLAKRTWSGLNLDETNTKSAELAVPGRSGLAGYYENDAKKLDSDEA